MANYGLFARGEFDSVAGINYRLDILQLDYSGAAIGLIMAADPVKQKWDSDDIYSPVRGSSLQIALVNVEGQLPLNTFYSNNDIQFKVEYSCINPTTLVREFLFYGFIVQDDCTELQVDYSHIINLSANDNLGLLKDVPLDYKLKTNPVGVYDFYEQCSIQIVDVHKIILANTNYTPKVGEIFSYADSDGVQLGILTPTIIVAGVDTWSITVTETLVPAPLAVYYVFSGSPFNPLLRNNLLSIIQVCLHNTSLELYTNIYANIFEIEFHNASTFLQQTFIDTQTFYSGDKYNDCWTVLTKVLGRFRLSLFQSGGEWRIVRWDEIRIRKDIPFYRYTTTMTLYNRGVLDNQFTFGYEQLTYPEYGVTKGITRPYISAKETFDYNTPKYLLKNWDLQDTGALTSHVETGSGVNKLYIDNYVANWWLLTNPLANRPTYHIRVVRDWLRNEIERYITVENGQIATSQISCTPIEVNKLSRFRLSFEFRTTASQPSVGSIVFAIRLRNGTTTQFVDEANIWQNGPGFNYSAILNTNSWQTVTVEVYGKEIPIIYDGILDFFLNQINYTGVGETHYRNFNFEFSPYYISALYKVNGQIHLEKQVDETKNLSDISVDIDDSPKNSVSGALYQVGYKNLIKIRTTKWQRLGIAESKNLGEITTQDNLFQHRIPRSKFEGTFYGLVQNSNIFSPLSLVNYVNLTNLNFVAGQTTINYAKDKVDTNLYEVANDTEVETDLTSEYTFTYKYEK